MVPDPVEMNLWSTHLGAADFSGDAQEIGARAHAAAMVGPTAGALSLYAFAYGRIGTHDRRESDRVAGYR